MSQAKEALSAGVVLSPQQARNKKDRAAAQKAAIKSQEQRVKRLEDQLKAQTQRLKEMKSEGGQ